VPEPLLRVGVGRDAPEVTSASLVGVQRMQSSYIGCSEAAVLAQAVSSAARENGNFVDKQKDGKRKVSVLVNIFGNQLDVSFCHFIV
jgi:hypothetical protein